MSSHSGLSIKKLYSRSVRALRRSNHSDALMLTQEIIDRQADHPGAHAVQFSSLFKSKKFELARLMGNEAAKHNPKSVFILNNQACLELEKNNPAPAAQLLSSLIEHYGEQAQWVYNLALAYELSGKYEKAISMYRRTLDQDPQHEKAARKLSETSQLLGHYEEATQSYNYWRLLNSKNEMSHCEYIHSAAKSNNISATDLNIELNLWKDRFIPKGKRYEKEDVSAKKSLNIGFIYSGFDYDWLNKIVIPVANQLVENGDQVIFYSTSAILGVDESISTVLTQRASDADFARRVRKDKVDVLIDLCGMRKDNRQRAMGLQLASKQYSWLNHEGYFATPLISSLDHKLEQTYIAKTDNPGTDKTKWPKNTFAGLAGQNGLSYQVIKAWASILTMCPDWSLNIDTKRLKSEPAQISDVLKANIEKLLLQRFSAAGIERSRITFETNLQADKNTIALDNFCNNDPIALSEYLLNGATAVTLHNDLHPGQRNTQLIKQLGIDANTSEDSSAFINNAIALANGKSNLSPLSASKKHQTKLANISDFTKHFRKTIID